MTLRALGVAALAAPIVVPFHAAEANVVNDSNRLASVRNAAGKGAKLAKDGVDLVKFVGPCVGRRAFGGRC